MDFLFGAADVSCNLLFLAPFKGFNITPGLTSESTLRLNLSGFASSKKCFLSPFVWIDLIEVS